MIRLVTVRVLMVVILVLGFLAGSALAHGHWHTMGGWLLAAILLTFF